MKWNIPRIHSYSLLKILCIQLAVLLAFKASAFRAPDRPALPNFDKRPRAAAREGQPEPAQKVELERLRAMLPAAKADFHPVTGSPKFVSAGEGYLTQAGGAGKAVLPATAARYTADPHGPTKAFLREHQPLFGFGPEALDRALVQREFVTPHNGLKTVVWQQQLSGIPVFEALLISHTTKGGELVNISSQFIPEPPATAKLSGTPGITASHAVAFAAQNVGEDTKPDQVSSAVNVATTPSQRQRLQAPGLSGEADASLVWLPMSKDTVRLCWEVILTSRSRGEMFRLVVDAQTGEVLARHGLTEYLSDVTYRVFTNDSPSPFSPGWPTPNAGQPALVQRELVTLSALDTNASPQGWIPDGANETLGNNVDAHTDLNADDVPDLPRPQGSPNRVFDFPLDLTTQAPSSYRPAAVAQLFYLNNWFHDRVYELGFTEAAGNFQNNNFGRGGLGNDRVQADAQDGEGFNNANFATPPDGSAPRMQMFVFQNPNPDRDGDLDAEIVFHEYTHGLSNRRVGGGAGLTALQSRGMGEGWSDFYALAMLSQPGDDPNACYAAGAYASYLIGSSTDNLNYYFGIRRYPYSTDMTKNPLTFKDIDPAQADYCASGAPFHTGMFGSCSTGNPSEVHNQGEVWCVTLWEARANLIARHGWAVGNELILQLVTDGMNLAPPNPNFLQARDAILQADGGANRNELWAAFAKRGMGWRATSPSSGSVANLRESFDMPDDLQVRPQTGFVSSGPVGGPFSITAQSFFLTNFGAAPLTWSLVNTSLWLNASLSTGTLLPGGAEATVDVALNTVANSLPAGLYYATLLFSNVSSQIKQSCSFLLRVGQPDYYTELFESTINDLAFSSLTFTPDGSPSFYRVCRSPAFAFPTDPADGNNVFLGDDDFISVNLNGTSVSLYGQASSVFYLGSNGYLTFNSGDTSVSESFADHFNRPRISALYHDLYPLASVGGSVSWKQLANRVVVTFANVPDYDRTGPNNFQIEWFFDGRIRITYLNLSCRYNLVGLSRGTGIPAGFMASDLSDGHLCDALVLSLPSSAAENAGVLANAGRVAVPNPFPTNLTVTLSSSAPSQATVPPQIVITAGQTNADFDVTFIDDALLDGSQMATVTAVSASLDSVSQAILVHDNETASLSLELPSTLVEGQGAAQGFVRVSAAVGADVSISLSSGNTNKIIVPDGIEIAAGQDSAIFPITIVDDFTPNSTTDVSITAHVQNWTDASRAISVLDNPVPIVVVRNPSVISIPDSGAATPYPSSITVAGVAGLISSVVVTLTNMTHSYPDDLAVLLVGPTGTNLVLMANVGGSTDLVGAALTFDDAATSSMPDGGSLSSGVYRPTAITPPSFPAPAPYLGRGSSLAAFNNLNPNGIWRLFVYDDAGGDTGQIADGWSLRIQTHLALAPAPLLRAPVISGNQIQIGFQTVSSHTYFVEWTQDLTENSWFPLTAVAGDGTIKTVLDTVGTGPRSYRVRVQ